MRIPKEIVLNSLAPTCPMLVQAQVVPWWGTGRPAEFSPSGFHPVTGIAYRREDSGVRLLNRVDLATASGQLHALPGNEKFEFFGAPCLGVGVFGKLLNEVSEISPGAGLDLLG